MILKLKDKEIWEKLLLKINSKNRDIYYTPEYYSLYQALGDGTALCFVYESNEEIAIYPFLINSINSLGFDLDKEYFDIQGAYGYNGIISTCQEPDFINDFYEKFNKYCQDENIIAEFTRFNPILANQNFSKEHLSCSFNRNTVSVDLKQSHDEITTQFNSSCKRAIKKAKKSNLTVKVYKNKYPFKEAFIEMYYETMNRLNSIDYLLFNDKYLNRLFDELNPDHFVVFYNEIPIASSICITSENYSHYHLGASYSQHLDLRPNNILFSEMIKIAKEKEYELLHLGGGNSEKFDDSLLRYKKHFSKNISDFYIGKRIHNQSVYNEVLSQWRHKNKNQDNNMFLRYRY